MNPISRIKALALMRYHLAKQDQWQRKVEARERENLHLVRRTRTQDWALSIPSLQMPEEYQMKRMCDEDFWLKQYTGNRDHHQKQAMMWAAAADALREKTDDQ